MNTTKNLQIVSLYFFLITGLIHFSSGLMYVNGYYSTISLFINKISDLPFILSSLCYLGASIKLSIDKNPNKKLDITLLSVFGFIFIFILILNIKLHDIR